MLVPSFPRRSSALSRVAVVGTLALLAWLAEGARPVGASLCSEGAGESYWGPIPVRADSVTARYESPTPSAWELPLLGLWWVAKAPFELVDYGIETAVVALDESGTIHRIRQLLAPVDLPYGWRLNGAVNELTGVGGGLEFFHDAPFGSRSRMQVKTRITSKAHTYAAGGFVVELGPRASVFEWGGGYRKRTNARFFGLGPFTDESLESYFTQEVGWAGASYGYDLGRGAVLQADALYSWLHNRGPRKPEEDVPLSTVFASDLPTGWGENSNGWSWRVALEHDDTEDTGRPRSGGVRRARVARFLPEASDQAAFWSYRLEAQQFVDLWWDRVLALRGYWAWIDGGGEAVHFQRLLTNDDPDHMRGYRDFRWRGHGMSMLTAEYRWPVWAFREVGRTGLDGYAFVDSGQAFEDHEQISLDAFATSYGFGFRLANSRGFSTRIEVGFSDEETVFRIDAHQVFQYDKHGLYHGRSPVPSR